MTRETPGRILIVGGGTAGWMAAALMAHAWAGRGAEITLLESDVIGIIGVGEGSTPKMRRFFDKLGVPEAEWMPRCNATYKCGIRFPAWSTRKGFESYYHPFFAAQDDATIRAFFNNLSLRNRNFDVAAHPDAFFVSNYLAENRRAPVPEGGQYQTDYAYHFDATLIGELLKEKSMAMGVRHLVDTVTSVARDEAGPIRAVETEKHGTVEADFFVDCTGFAGLLLQKTLGVPFQSFSDILFNDRAVALPTPVEADGTLPSETVSTALKCGWVWKIPLQNRFGNGYVYSSRFLSEDEAEQELRAHIGLENDPAPARHLKMRVGRVDRPWAENCLAVGLSQGFVEPLEATALMIVQDTIENFIGAFEAGGFGPGKREEFNTRVNKIFDGVKDYIFMHYKLNSRTDTDYWIENRENENLSDVVREVLAVWKKGGDLLEVLKARSGDLVYSPTSWFCILAGMGHFPRRPKKPKPNQQISDLKAIHAYCADLATRFPDHRQAMDRMLSDAPAQSPAQ